MTTKMSRRRRSVLAGMCAGLGSAALAPAGAADSADEQRLHTDWPFLRRYADENAALRAGGTPVDAVFLGDSITEGWLSKAPAFFTPGRVCRGIGGQTTPQMLLRFRQDVIDLRPAMVHIMGGTNDIAGNTGPSTLQMVQDNYLGMTDIAMANHVHLIFASIPPAHDFPWRPGLDTRTPIAALNEWLQDHARRVHATYANYFAVLADGEGGMRRGLASDGVHPTEEGYALMRPVAEAALKQAAGLHRLGR
ncbi:MAG: GDSL-type esterase/lipase family protein [Steroidobacteraceae bacterium]